MDLGRAVGYLVAVGLLL